MNKIKILYMKVLIISLITTSQSIASTIIINFDPAPNGIYLTSDYFEGGFKMEVISGHYDIINAPFSSNGTNFLALDQLSEPSVVKFTNIQGMPFDFISYENINLPSLLIQSSAGGNISLGHTGLNFFNGANWSNLSWLSFTSAVDIGGVGVDSITLKTVPVPTAVLLFGPGFLGLIGVAVNRKGRKERVKC